MTALRQQDWVNGVDRDAFETLARLLRVHPGDEALLAVGVGLAAAGVELPGLAGDALGDDAGVLVDQDAHVLSSNPSGSGGDDLGSGPGLRPFTSLRDMSLHRNRVVRASARPPRFWSRPRPWCRR